MPQPKKIIKLDRTSKGIPDHILKSLDEEQLDAVINSKGRSLIIAGPGSGKTRVITYKVAYLVESGVRPQEILLVTFTRRAAKEMIARAQAVTQVDLSGMLAGTFHHVCNVILRQYAGVLGLPSNFTILDREDALSLIKIAKREWIRRAYQQGGEPRLPSPSVLQDIFSFSANTCVPLGDAILEKHPNFYFILEDIIAIFEDFTRRKKAQGALDYDDLLVYCLKLLEKNPGIRQRVAGRFTWVLVDEFQDTSLIQARLVELFASVHGNLIVVGDDAQSIYSFRGARYQNILDFAENEDCKVFKIQNNYRSTNQLVDLTNAKIPNNVFKKVLQAVRGDGPRPVIITTLDGKDEAIFVAQKIVELINSGVEPQQIGVLYRAHAHSIDLQMELTARGINFDIYSGVKFVEAAHVKDILAFLRIIHNPKDQIAWDRALMLFEGIGRVTADRLAQNIIGVIEQGKDPFEFLESVRLNRAEENFAEFKSIVTKLRALSNPSEMIKEVYQVFYKSYLEWRYSDFRERQRDIERLIQIAERYSSLEEFLAELFLSERMEIEREGGGGEGRVVLSTIHQAKGLEWSVVFVLAVNPGDLPSGWAIEEGNLDEEERIFYVAITRAKDELYLCRQQLDSLPELSSDSLIIRSGMIDFLADIPEELVEEWIVQ